MLSVPSYHPTASDDQRHGRSTILISEQLRPKHLVLTEDMGSLGAHQVEPPLGEDLELFTTLNDVLETRALTHSDRPLVSYPKNETDLVDYTGAELNQLTQRVAIHAARAFGELGPNHGDRLDQRKLVVAIVGISSLEYYLTFLSLQRLGITTVFISPRLADPGYIHLLKETRCEIAIASGPSFITLERLQKDDSLSESFTLLPMIDNTFLERECNAIDISDFRPLCFDPAPGFIIHSGGTTGLPKPVPLAASAWLTQASDIVRRIPRVDTLSTLPLFHSFGLATLLRGLVSGTRLSLLNASRPVTAANVIKCLNNTSSEALVTVPYILKFLIEADGGLERLGALRQVISAGSAIPDDLGDKIVTAGGNIFHLYGQTECGALMEPPSDRWLWSWVTPLPHAKPYLQFEPESTGSASQDLYHLVIRPGLKQKVLSDRPDGSYGTKDLFQRHPTIPDLWKFAARKDDIIVMLNGEKADPIPLEDAVRVNPEVATAVAFGAGQEALGLVVIKSHSSATLPHEEFVKAIGPSIDLGNSRVPAYARIARDMIIVKEAGTPFPATDKGTVIRSAFLKEMNEDIERLYAGRSATKLKNTCTGVPMTHDEVLAIISEIVKDELRSRNAHGTSTLERGAVDETKSWDDLSIDADLFNLGVDSLQASNIRSRIQRAIDLRGLSLATNVVFDYPTVSLLGDHVMQLHLGNTVNSELTDPEQLARAMVEKYSKFTSTEPGAEVVNVPAKTKTVLLTGATGQVGAHLLFSLLSRPDVKSILCLVRAQSHQDGLARLHLALNDAGLLTGLSATQLEKIVACPGDLSDTSGCFSPSNPVYSRILNTVTTFIHNAWPVNFSLSLQSFEAQAIRPTHNLINLALRSNLRPKPSFTFVSSISTVLNAGPEVLEKPYPWESVGPMGYGQSKWVAEEILAAAATAGGEGLGSAQVARLGQVVGDTRLGRWKASEAYPAVAQSALTVGALPLIEAASDGLVHDEHFWLPVDVVGAAIADVALCHGDEQRDNPSVPVSYFNVSSVVPMRWNSEFAPAVKESLAQYGVLCELVPQREWLRRLEESDPDVTRNPPRKLLDFFQRRYGRTEVEGQPVLSEPALVITKRSMSSTWAADRHEWAELFAKCVRYWVVECWNRPTA